MMSGYSVEEQRKKAMVYGAVACIKKPFEMEEIRQVIKTATGKEV